MAKMNGPSESVNLHYFIIKVQDGQTLVDYMEWQDLYFHTLANWRWYFDYRAALLKVKYPKLTVNCFWGHYPAHGPQKIDQLKNRIRSKKAKITQIKNRVEAFVKEWDELFSYEDDVIYQKVIEKLNRLEKELKSMELEYESELKQNGKNN